MEELNGKLVSYLAQPYQEPDISLTPDYLDPLAGFRTWRLRLGDLSLLAPFRPHVWKPGVNKAQCKEIIEQASLRGITREPELLGGLLSNLKKHDSLTHPIAPGTGCECGLYAYKELSGLPIYGYPEIAGKVLMWGKCELYEVGIRSQYAKVLELEVPRKIGPHTLSRLKALAERYGADLVSFGGLSS